MKPCPSTNPDTGSPCTMAEGHAGPHVIGNPYHPRERWVTQCVATPCDYHGNRDITGNQWDECIRCGDRKPFGYGDLLQGDYRFLTGDHAFSITLSPTAKVELVESCKSPPSRIRMIWAKFRCNCYLLAHGMWHGQCELDGWDKNNRVSFIAAVTGSNFNYRAERVFYGHVAL